MVYLCSKKRAFLFLCIVSLCFSLALYWNFICWNRKTLLLVDHLCDDVESGRAIGNLCKEICGGALDSYNCQALHGGKEVVFSAQFHANPVFVKGRRTDVLGNEEENLFWKDKNGTEHFPNIAEFKSIIKSHLIYNFNVSYSERVFYKLWKSPLKIESFSPTQNQQLQKLSLKTLWGLLQDPEFVVLSVLEHNDIFPELYGTCGGFYIVEELKQIQYPTIVSQLDFTAFVRNVKIALGILDLLAELENSFEEPIYLCDVKQEHFGVSDFGKVKYLDLDNVYLKPIIDRSIGESTRCDNHSDCDFFDCKGTCDLLHNKCFPGATNNNLQVICEKIFLGTDLGFQGLSTGLLSSSHSTDALRNFVKSCANPSASKDGTRIKADFTLMQNLRSALKEFVTVESKLKEFL